MQIKCCSAAFVQQSRPYWKGLSGRYPETPDTNETAVRKMIRDESYYQALRRPQKDGDNQLTEFAVDWILHFPPKYRPHNLAKQYPRIVNILAANWTNQAEIGALLQEYIFSSRREERQGFPQASLHDLLMLMDVYNQKNGNSSDVWAIAEFDAVGTLL
jgi:hypothetical protein